MEKAFNISNLFSDSWTIFKNNWKFAILVSIIVVVIQLVFSMFGYDVDPTTGVATGAAATAAGVGTEAAGAAAAQPPRPC